MINTLFLFQAHKTDTIFFFLSMIKYSSWRRFLVRPGILIDIVVTSRSLSLTPYTLRPFSHFSYNVCIRMRNFFFSTCCSWFNFWFLEVLICICFFFFFWICHGCRGFLMIFFLWVCEFEKVVKFASPHEESTYGQTTRAHRTETPNGI